MAVDLKALGLDKLTVAEKRELADALWDEADAEALPSGLTDSQRDELRRRIAHADANPDDYVTWEEVRAGIERRLGIDAARPTAVIRSAPGNEYER